jgi:hypothetical protein
MRRALSYSFLDNAMAATTEKFGRRLTQMQLAALLGIAQPSVSEWKTTRAKIEHAQILALKTGHCVEWLYNRTGPRHPWDAQAQGDKRMQELMSIWNQLSEEGRSRLLGASVTLLQDFREQPPSEPPSGDPSPDQRTDPPAYHAHSAEID